MTTETTRASAGAPVRSEALLAFYESVAPLLRRLREPMFESETPDYICGSGDCRNAIDALNAIEANARPVLPADRPRAGDKQDRVVGHSEGT